MSRPKTRVRTALLLIIAVLACGLGLAPVPAFAGGGSAIAGTLERAPVPMAPEQSPEVFECMFHVFRLDGSRAKLQREYCGKTFVIDDLAAGTYRLLVVPTPESRRWAQTWAGNTPYESVASLIEVPANETVSGVDITLPRAGQVGGTVRTADGRAPSGPLTAYASTIDPAAGKTTIIMWDEADADGSYTIDGLPPADHVIRFADSGLYPTYADTYYGGTTLPTADRVEVSAASQTNAIDGTLSRSILRNVSRLAGTDRYQTAATISKRFASGAPVVYVANGTSWPDALSAGPAAAYLGGPLLLTARDALPAATTSELARLHPKRIVVVGGEGVVSRRVLSELGAYSSDVDRVSGSERYATSRAVVEDAFGGAGYSRHTFVASGRGFADALSAGAAAAARSMPLLLLDGNASLDPSSRAVLWAVTGTAGITAVGGPAVIDDDLLDELGHFSESNQAERLGGADRFATNREVLDSLVPSSITPSGQLYVANGYGFADALTGIPLAGMNRAGIALTPSNCIPAATLRSAVALRVTDWTLLGGTGVLDGRVANLTSC